MRRAGLRSALLSTYGKYIVELLNLQIYAMPALRLALVTSSPNFGVSKCCILK